MPTVWQLQKKGFIFSNYQSQNNNGNPLFKSDNILKQKWHWTTKNGMLKCEYEKKYLLSVVITACHFLSFKKLQFYDILFNSSDHNTIYNIYTV